MERVGEKVSVSACEVSPAVVESFRSDSPFAVGIFYSFRLLLSPPLTKICCVFAKLVDRFFSRCTLVRAESNVVLLAKIMPSP